MSRVEVVMCTSNGMLYVPEQLESILAQACPVDRIIINDDVSTDGTLGCLRAARSPNAVVLTQNGQCRGAATNFSQALAYVEGEFVLLADQDDLWHRDKVERLLAAFEGDPETLLVHSDARIVDATGQDTGKTLFGEYRYSRAEREQRDRGGAFVISIRQNRVPGATAALRREILEFALPIPPGLCHDEWLALVAASLGRVRWVDAPLIDYRIHGGNQVGIPSKVPSARFPALRWDRGDYCIRRARTLEILLARLRAGGVRVPKDRLQLVADAHWLERAQLPTPRWSRLPAIRRQLRCGGYHRFSNGLRRAIRDLLETLPVLG